MAKKGAYKIKKRRAAKGKRGGAGRKSKKRRPVAFLLSITEEPLYPLNSATEEDETHDEEEEDTAEALSTYLHELPTVPTIRR